MATITASLIRMNRSHPAMPIFAAAGMEPIRVTTTAKRRTISRNRGWSDYAKPGWPNWPPRFFVGASGQAIETEGIGRKEFATAFGDQEHVLEAESGAESGHIGARFDRDNIAHAQLRTAFAIQIRTLMGAQTDSV